MRLTDQFTNNNGVRIHSIQSGFVRNNLTPLVYLPGALGTAEQFTAEIDALSPRLCLSLSLRGRGKSETPLSGYSIDDHVSDIASVIRNQDLSSFCLMAYSMSVPYAIQYAFENQNQVKALILCDYPARYPAIPFAWAERILENNDLSERAVQGIQQESREIVFWDVLAQLDLPVFVLHGGTEAALLKPDSIQLYKEKVKDVTIIPFPFSGHELWEPDYDTFLQSIESILKQLDESSFSEKDSAQLKRYSDSLKPVSDRAYIEGFGQLIAKGNTATIYQQNNDIVKVFNDWLPATEAQREADKHKQIEKTGLPVPIISDVTEIQGKRAIMMEYIPGQTFGELLTDSKSKLNTYMERSIHIQQEIHKHTASIEKMTDKLTNQLNAAPDLTSYQVTALLEKMNKLSFENRLCHGDFHLFNLIESGDRSVIIDWVDASMGDPYADVCRSYLLYQNLSKPFAERYLALYCTISQTPKHLITQWQPILAGARLAEGVSGEEKRRLLDFVKYFVQERKD